MFTTLRTRLLLSYVLIVGVTITVIGVALLLMLQARPVPTDEISARLAVSLNDYALRREFERIPAGGITRAQERILNALARAARLRNFPVRILIVRLSDKVVNYDSANDIVAGSEIALDVQPYTPPSNLGIDLSGARMWRGGFTNLDGTAWRFVAMETGGDASGWAFALALRAPQELSLTELVQYLGEDLVIPLLQAGMIGLLVAVFMAFVIARSVARPLQEIARAARTVAQGDMTGRAPVSGPREARVVAESFNQMTAQVQAAQQAQRDFLANVTHDLKTPLTSIQGFSQAIFDGVAANPEAAQRAATIIHEEAGRLNRMVEELLDLARIEAGRWNMTRHTVQLDDILDAIGERLTPKARQKGIALEVLKMPLPPISGDGDRLVQVFTNLADNALKFTPEGGKVTLRAGYHNAGVQVQVSDTGEGIPAEDLPHIFDRFYQVDKSRQRGERVGTGLGLTITKGIVDAHGGTISVASLPGQGTTFTVWFPAPASDATTLIRRRTGTFKRAGTSQAGTP